MKSVLMRGFAFIFLLMFISGEIMALDYRSQYDANRRCSWPCAVSGGDCAVVSNSCETLGSGACGPGTGNGPSQ